MSDINLTQLQSVLSDFAPQGRSALLPALHAAQNLYGYLTEPVAAEVGQALQVPLADVYGVIDFYGMFYREPVGKTIIRVCTDPACALAGGEDVLDATCRHLNVAPGEMRPDGSFTVERAPCLGLCDHAPAVLVGDDPIGDIDPGEVALVTAGLGQKPVGIIAGDPRILTANCGKEQPASLGEYEAGGGYAALKKALKMTPQAVIAEVKNSGLVGRGGAAFPTGIKWEGAAQAAGSPKYVVCNADESEPGTFKDRVLLQEDPHQILEGMIIAAYAIGAHQGYIYLRGEYAYVNQVLSSALDEARQAGYLGKDILGSGLDFDVEIRLGAGAYICGEETALFESIEGKRGFPRVKPPFPTTSGLFHKPTVINNVETLCNVPHIIVNGAAAYRQYGTQKSPGTKLLCLSGDIEKPGLYEVPFGVSILHLVNDLAGGVRNGRRLRAILFGGAAGAFASPDDLDLPITFEDLGAAGIPLGSGVLTVFDDTRDMRVVLMQIARFFAEESCGKCYPCQLGTERQYEILKRISNGRPQPGDSQRLEDVGWTMTDASLCALGQTAATAVVSAMRLWPDIFRP